MPEAISLRHLLHLRPGIGDGNEMGAGLIRAYSFGCEVKEILLENIRFECASRLARNNEERLGDIDLIFKCLYLRRVCGIEDMQIGISGGPAKRHAQNLGTQARPSHAEQKNVLETRAPDFLGKIPQLHPVRDLLLGYV